MTAKVVTSALTAVLILGANSMVMAEEAGSTHSLQNPNMEKCYGVAKAGKNDCGTAHDACAGSSKVDAAKDAYIELPKGTCKKIVGGSLDEGPAPDSHN